MKKFITISAASVAALGLGVLSAGTAFAATATATAPTITNVTAPATTNYVPTISVSVNGLLNGGMPHFEEEVGTAWQPATLVGVSYKSPFTVKYLTGATAVRMDETMGGYSGVPLTTMPYSNIFPIPSSTTSPSGPTLPGPGKDYFLLTHFSASPMKGAANTYTLTVTVEQYQFDGNDLTNNETHYFPTTVPVTWAGGNATASLAGSPPGINYLKGQTGTVSSTAQYTLHFNQPLTSTTQLSIGPFYMTGPVQKNSPDDVVYDSPITIPYGQLPEVPFAVGIPVVGLGAAALLLKRRALRA